MNERETRRRGPGCASGCLLVFLLVALVVSLSANGLLMLGLSLRDLTHLAESEYGPVDEYPELAEVWSYGGGEAVVVRIPVVGVIMRNGESALWGTTEDMVESILQQIRAAQADERVMGLLLDVDSPGGAVTPTDEIYKALSDFRASRTDRRIVAFSRDILASGAYFIAAAADAIVAEPTTLVGSISVMMQALNWKALSDKIGVTDVTIVSGEHKGLLNPFQDVKDEDVQILQDIINSLHDHFIDRVSEGRSMTPEALRPYADGRVFLAKVALEAGLIDQIGYWPDAIGKVAELLEVDDVRVIRYQQEFSLADLFKQMRPGFSLRGLVAPSSARFMYLWNPSM